MGKAGFFTPQLATSSEILRSLRLLKFKKEGLDGQHKEDKNRVQALFDFDPYIFYLLANLSSLFLKGFGRGF